jgi:hypothetical protein
MVSSSIDPCRIKVKALYFILSYSLAYANGSDYIYLERFWFVNFLKIYIRCTIYLSSDNFQMNNE